MEGDGLVVRDHGVLLPMHRQDGGHPLVDDPDGGVSSREVRDPGLIPRPGSSVVGCRHGLGEVGVHRLDIGDAKPVDDAGDPEAAILLYAESVADGTAELPDYLELAAANLAAGRFVEAVKGYEGVLRSYPFHREALEGLAGAAAAAGASEAQTEARGKL